MADASKEKNEEETEDEAFSCFLFTKDDGSPMVFRFHPCSEKPHLRRLVEAGGGQVTIAESPDVIRLVSPGSTAKSSDMVSSTYIYDCVKANKLLDIKDYRVTKGHAFDSLPTSLNMQSKSLSGRSTYFVSEDRAIINFLLSNNAVGAAGGNKVWKQMETYRVTQHSWQSAKDRFRKHILPNIRQYCLPQEDVEKFLKKASGNRTTSRATRTRSADYSSSAEEDNVENDDDDDDKPASDDDESDEFDTNLVRLARCSDRAVKEPVESEYRSETAVEAAVEQSESRQQTKKRKLFVSGGIFGKPSETSPGSGFIKGKRKAGETRRGNGTDGSTNSSPRLTLGQKPVSDEETGSPGHAKKSRDIKNRNDRVCVEQNVMHQDVTKCCRTEKALADSQTSGESYSEREKTTTRKVIQSSSKDSSIKSKANSDKRLFPSAYSPRQRSSIKQNEPGQILSGKQKTRLSANCDGGSVEDEDVGDAPTSQKVSFRTGLRRFVVNLDSDDAVSAETADNELEIHSKAVTEKTLATCDKLIDWLNISPAVFAHAVFQSNGSVDRAVNMLLGNDVQLWEPNDDENLFSEGESVMKNLEQKYGKQLVAERMKFLEENPMFYN